MNTINEINNKIKLYVLNSFSKIYFLFYLQSPKYTPPIEFVDQAALSPPEGYKDGGANLQQALGGALGGHIFGAQHMQQLQVIQRLQAQRAAMLAARASVNNSSQLNASGHIPRGNQSSPQPPANNTVCTECAECTECASKQEHIEGKNNYCAYPYFYV